MSTSFYCKLLFTTVALISIAGRSFKKNILLQKIKALSYGFKNIEFYLDSLLVVNQMINIFKIKNRELWPIHEDIKRLLGNFGKVTFTHVPRERNKLADSEVNKILDSYEKR